MRAAIAVEQNHIRSNGETGFHWTVWQVKGNKRVCVALKAEFQGGGRRVRCDANEATRTDASSLN